MTRRPRALHIAPIMPARSGNGLAMRQGIFLEALSLAFDTHLVVLPVAGNFKDLSSLPDELGVRTTVIPVAGRQDTQFSLLARLIDPAARLAAFRAYSRSSLAAHVSAAVLEDLRDALGEDQYDLVHIGRSYLTDVLEVVGAVKATRDLDEDEWTSYRELAATTYANNRVHADWAEAEAAAIAGLIGRSAARFVSNFISGEPDVGWLTTRHPDLTIEVVENAVSIPSQRRRCDDGGTLLFLGSFGYAPNLDAVEWLVEAIWPAIRARSDRALRLLIAGRDADRIATLANYPGVEVLGEVDDVSDAYAAATVFVAPLRAGAGTRLKLLEAAAHCVPIVSSNLGTRGLRFLADAHLLAADDAACFASAVLSAITDRAVSESRAEAALSIVRQHHDRARTVDHLACRLHAIAAK
jgi:polysaccharide biosynthesis protein PslH